MEEVCRFLLDDENSGRVTELRNSSAILSCRAVLGGGGDGESDLVGDLFALLFFLSLPSLRSLLGDEWDLCFLLFLSSSEALLLLRLLFSLGRNSSSTSMYRFPSYFFTLAEVTEALESEPLAAAKKEEEKSTTAINHSKDQR